MENNNNRSSKRKQVSRGTAKQKPSQSTTTRTAKQRGANAQAAKRVAKGKKQLTPKQLARKRRNKILLFIAEIFAILLLLVIFWAVNKAGKIERIEIKEEDIILNPGLDKIIEETPMKGYRNIALFGVDATNSKLDGNTRTDTMIIVSINQDTKEVKMVSLLRDTYVNLSTDVYAKANSAYARGGAQQAINMMNMNLDLDISDFVTVGFDGLIEAIDLMGGIEIDVTEAEISYLNSYQISIAGRPDGTLNAAGEKNYTADPYVDYIPVTEPGLQTLNGLQATAYCRIRYVGNDFGRTQRQRTVLTEIAKKAMTLSPAKLDQIAEAVFPKVATSLKLSEILSLLADVANYKIGENASFPFEGEYRTGVIGNKGDCVVPTTLEENVIKLHEFFFGSTEEDYTPTETVKKCSEKIYSDTSAYLK